MLLTACCSPEVWDARARSSGSVRGTLSLYQAGLAAQCEEGAGWGFTGKQVIHPGQVETVQAAFTPSLARLDWANSLMEAFKQNQ